MSQSDLAQAVGKSPAYTNQTMTGRKHASPEWVNLVAETLSLSQKERVVLHRAAAKDQGYEIDLGVYKPKKSDVNSRCLRFFDRHHPSAISLSLVAHGPVRRATSTRPSSISKSAKARRRSIR
jgi:hypothetical protein